VACVGNGLPLSDHITLQPARQLIHTAAPIQGRANTPPSASRFRMFSAPPPYLIASAPPV
jgi:hypothetical protein